MFSRALVAFIAASVVLASPLASSGPLVHEQRHVLPEGWAKSRRHFSGAPLALRFGLAQRNLDRIEELLHDISHPDSENYGNHWSAGDVLNMFSPSMETVDAVRGWLTGEGIHPDRIRLSNNKGWISLNVTVDEAEQLLGTEYNVYEHDSGVAHVACDKYHLPEHISKHVEMVTPTVHFDGMLLNKRGNGMARNVGQPGFGTVVPQQAGTFSNIVDQLENCDTHITPICLQALYGVPPPIFGNWGTKATYGIVEYTPQAYLASDLDLFMKNYSSNLVGRRPTLVSIDGGVVQTTSQGFGFNGESNLDLQYGQVLIGSQDITLYQVGDMVEGASFNNFLDAIDGNYCSFEGGDDPSQDGVYPDPFGTGPGAYQGKQDCGISKPTNVISTSYGYNEADLSPAYAARQCAEYAKLGLMGVTVLYSSGDNGVGGNGGACLNADGTQSKTGKIFNPSFPPSCPYVTAVGATQLPAGKNVLLDDESATYEVIWSGGGFSNYFPMPAYQKSAVNKYIQKYNPAKTYPGLFNTTGTRAFPDISANGANYVVAVTGIAARVFGTSASTPVMGALLTLVNNGRLALGKKPIGFINNAIYSNGFANAWNDITNGTNNGCGVNGFAAVPGWDPVTGLGTPDFLVMLTKFLSLP